jgi:hypothetical protein
VLNFNITSTDLLARLFSQAAPFKHVSIDNFLSEDLARGLCEQFPSFDPAYAKNEMGIVGRKATREDVCALGSAYLEVDRFFSSSEFLSYLSDLTGIPDLLFDPEYFGGGTHENLHGQELDVHVDFNYHRSSKLHRRLNLIVYLNNEWDESWGGNIEVHSDPRNPDTNIVKHYAPRYNRCVIFETNEKSWHGFSEITLPVDKRHLSRKSFTIYYYTKTRPENEIVPPHNTFYIQRPLPDNIKPETLLSRKDHQIIKGLLVKRDSWLHHYQKLEIDLNKRILDLEHLARELQISQRLPILGYVTQRRVAAGHYPDGWLSNRFSVQLYTEKVVKQIIIVGTVPQGLPVNEVYILLDDVIIYKGALVPGQKLDLCLDVQIDISKEINLEIRSDVAFCPQRLGLSTDSRELLVNLEKLIFTHLPE